MPYKIPNKLPHSQAGYTFTQELCCYLEDFLISWKRDRTFFGPYSCPNLESQEDTLCRGEFLCAIAVILFEISKEV